METEISNSRAKGKAQYAGDFEAIRNSLYGISERLGRTLSILMIQQSRLRGVLPMCLQEACINEGTVNR